MRSWIFIIGFIMVSFASAQQENKVEVLPYINVTKLVVAEPGIGISFKYKEKYRNGIEISGRPAISNDSYRVGDDDYFKRNYYKLRSPFSTNVVYCGLTNRYYFFKDYKAFVDLMPYYRYYWKDNSTLIKYNNDLNINETFNGDLTVTKVGLKLHVGNVFQLKKTKLEFYYGTNFFGSRLKIDSLTFDETQVLSIPKISFLKINSPIATHLQFGCNWIF